MQMEGDQAIEDRKPTIAVRRARIHSLVCYRRSDQLARVTTSENPIAPERTYRSSVATQVR